MKIEKLHYITQKTATLSHIDCVKEACISGVKWIQLRVKDASLQDYITTAKEARVICDLYDVQLIINDNVEVAILSNADGVHLGKNDMSPLEARTLLGKDKIIVGTANTAEDIENLINCGVDYIGLGPFKHTTTKKNLSPILGMDGYYTISGQVFNLLKDGELKTNIPPILAIGGIDLEDIVDLMKTGIDGIAVSGLLTTDFSLTEVIYEAITTKESLTIDILETKD
jgi:thiamine-phosphate pyrophosphorylase